jgi:nucleotide-binding universal stress UspA family protein
MRFVMSERMKLLFGYDGSSYADAALDDLRRAGLPREVEALVVSVGDALITPPLASHEVIEKAFTSKRAEIIIEQANKQASQSMEEANKLAVNASERVRSFFPDWLVRAEALGGAPSEELMRKADEWKAGLIVVGSQGRSALGRLFLGSVSETVAAEARCSVRVARRGTEQGETAPLRIVIGVDGSPGAGAAVSVVAARSWPPGSEARVVAVHSPFTLLATHYFVHPVSVASRDYQDEGALAQKIVDAAAENLRAAGINASPVVKEGDPKQVLVDEAKEWGASCIFLGAKGARGVERFLIGSVSASVAARANCSVEVIRT